MQPQPAQVIPIPTAGQLPAMELPPTAPPPTPERRGKLELRHDSLAVTTENDNRTFVVSESKLDRAVLESDLIPPPTLPRRRDRPCSQR